MSEHSASLTPSASDSVLLDEIIYEVCHLKHYVRNAPISATNPRFPTWSDEWMVQRIWEQPKEIAIRDLKKFVHKSRINEVTESLINNLNQGTEEQAQETLHFQKRDCTLRHQGNNKWIFPSQ